MRSVLDVQVLGKTRRVHVEKSVAQNVWAARTYAQSKTVSGFLRKNSNGSLRFTPMGVNAELLRS